MMEQQFDISRYLGILRRRWLFLVIPASLVFAGACLIALKLPKQYEATAKILVESQQIPTEMASPTVTTNAAERIQVLQQRLMTRDNLLQIATKFNLYASERGRLSPTDIVERMREAANISQIDVGLPLVRRDAGVIGFTVSFADENPSIAAQVANEFVTSILTQNIQTRLVRAEETSNFFQQELSRLEQSLLAMESRIAAFKRENEASLPDTLPYRRTLLMELSAEIAEIESKIRLAKLPADTTGSIDDNRLRQLSFRLRAKQLELDSVREERDTLAPLVESGVVPKNRVRDLERSISSAELEVESINAEIASNGGPGGSEAAIQILEGQRSLLEEKAAALNESIVSTPKVESELNALTRDYENLRTEYGQAKAKLADANTGERLEQDRQAERFEVLEQATVPDDPIKPNRRKIILAGSFGSLAVGLGVVMLMELLYRTIRSVADIERTLQLRPIAAIPYIATTFERRRRRWVIVGLIVLVLAAVVCGLSIIHFYYMPLDLVMEKVTRRLGV